MNITLNSISKYLDKVKSCVVKGQYRIWRTVENRALLDQFLVDESKIKEIVQNLVPEDFSEIIISTEKETQGDSLYVFGKEVTLLKRDSFNTLSVELYIKFDLIANQYVITLSFHTAEKPISYYFK